jgi:hypothetical protein
MLRMKLLPPPAQGHGILLILLIIICLHLGTPSLRVSPVRCIAGTYIAGTCTSTWFCAVLSIRWWGCTAGTTLSGGLVPLATPVVVGRDGSKSSLSVLPDELGNPEDD